MKKSIRAFPANMGIKERLILAKKAGFDAIEIELTEKGEINLESPGKEIAHIKNLTKETEMELSSLSTPLLWKYSLTSSDKSKREKAEGIVKKMLQIAFQLKVDTILVVPGAVDVWSDPKTEIVPYDVAYERSQEALCSLIKIAEEYRVNIGIENVWNKFLLSPLEMRDFIDKIGSKYLGSFFDVGNILAYGYPEQWIRILGKRIKKVHIKDFRKDIGNVTGFTSLLEGDVNWPAVMQAMGETGYDDFIIAELSPYKLYPEQLIKNTAKAMDKIMGR